MRRKAHVRFGERVGETGQPRGWHRAPARLHHNGDPSRAGPARACRRPGASDPPHRFVPPAAEATPQPGSPVEPNGPDEKHRSDLIADEFRRVDNAVTRAAPIRHLVLLTAVSPHRIQPARL